MLRLFSVITLFMLFAGCATSGRAVFPRVQVSAAGSYHELKPGESLSYLANIYNIELSELVRLNRIPDAGKVEVGQLIFIPQAKLKAKKREYVRPGRGEGFIWPVQGGVISDFGSSKAMVRNNGIDIRTTDSADVVASRRGRVTFASDHMEGYGKIIIIDHGGGFETVYAHNAMNLVRVDEEVKQGEVIAKAGNTGRANGPTLHFEIRNNHKARDPLEYLP